MIKSLHLKRFLVGSRLIRCSKKNTFDPHPMKTNKIAKLTDPISSHFLMYSNKEEHVRECTKRYEGSEDKKQGKRFLDRANSK